MAPANVSEDQLPLRPFEPLDYRNRKSNMVDEPVDPISLRLQVRFCFLLLLIVKYPIYSGAQNKWNECCLNQKGVAEGKSAVTPLSS